MSRRALRKHKRNANPDLDITAFMNLMVVLVPFLLLSAVFSQISILKMNLPALSDQAPKDEPKKPPLVLEIIILNNEVIINDRQTGPIARIPKKDEQYDFKRVNTFLADVKSKFPEISSATILSREETTYETIIQLMDAVRYTEQASPDGTTTMYELFPAISIGSSPE